MKYLLILFLHWHSPTVTQVGPFDDLIACERAAGQATIAAKEAFKNAKVSYACVGQRGMAIKLPTDEPVKVPKCKPVVGVLVPNGTVRCK